ncbi:hypothetical protein A2U01_0053440, partial [Trifolium medium]|nr:hypothetical protein [Trifolium medium]
YEGLHLLCINCGKSGHYEGCLDKTTDVEEVKGGWWPGDRDRRDERIWLTGSTVDGPWMVV